MLPIPNQLNVSDGSEPGGPDDVALDQKAQCRRYGRSHMTLRRWQDNQKILYPKASLYIAGIPHTWLSVLRAWERTQPARSALAGVNPKDASGANEAATYS
jgi:hypothetical protein